MKHLYVFVFLFLANAAAAQNFNPSDRDAGFNPVSWPTNQYFVDQTVQKCLALPDGKILLSDDQGKLIKLDGNLRDSGFNTGSGFAHASGAAIMDFLVQPDGKIVVCGRFTTYNGQNRRYVARLHPDGSLDTTFNLAVPAVNSEVLQVELQPDGKFVLLLYGTTSGSYNNIIRITATGSLDTTFNALPQNYMFQNIVLQPDGKIVVSHNSPNSFYSPKSKVSRLNPDGSFDSSFTTATMSHFGTNTENVYLRKILVQADGKILVGGTFNSPFTSTKDLVRLNADGTHDASFVLGAGFSHFENFSSVRFDDVADIVQQPDGKLIVCGKFSSFDIETRRNILRINTDGSLDTSFNDVYNFLNIDRVYSISQFSDGKLIAGGNMGVETKTDTYLVKINPDGTKDTAFNNKCQGFFNYGVNAVLETPDGKIVVGGNFHKYNGEKCYALARLNQDGTVDTTFNSGQLGFENPGGTATVTALAQQADGKIYVAGTFAQYNGQTVRSIIRLNTDGTRDTSFSVGNGFNSPIVSIVVRPAGGVIVGIQSYYPYYNGSSCSGLMYISNTGATVTGYDWDPTNVKFIKYQADGKLLVSGYYLGEYKGLKRYTTSGNVDSSFVLDPAISDDEITAFDFQQDGKIIICGEFKVNGNTRSIGRLLSDGSLDPSFNFAAQSATSGVHHFALMPDQKIVVEQYSTGTPAYQKLTRLHNDGSVDTAFAQSDIGWTSITPAANGKIYLHNSLQSYQGLPAWGLIRLMGENYYFLQGQNRLDANANGCDALDNVFSNMKYHISNSSNTYDFIANTTGSYNVVIPAGSYTVAPMVENPSYFNIAPANVTVNFPVQASPQSQNFCVTPNGIHQDLEVTVLPVNAARPGFDAVYKIVYKNKGNQLQSGTIAFGFDDALMDLTSALPATASQSLNTLNWNFSNLNPCETREIKLAFNLNAPGETPPVVSGSVLNYTASVTSAATDEAPADNTFALNQTVVNSFDPNDKTCLEGTSIATTKVGDYVHYIIRFENTGTYAAQDITVKDVIDTAKYEIASLMPTSGSHPFITRILDTNKVEFYFENINLPFADATNDGYVAFKIRTKGTLAEGDSFSNSAAIYFDYNHPIITNTATTTVQSLGGSDFAAEGMVALYPNPVKNVLNIDAKDTVSSLSIYNALGQLVMVVTNAANTASVDVSGLSAGNYIVKLKSGTGIFTSKFIKL